jgi:hypothetical protein
MVFGLVSMRWTQAVAQQPVSYWHYDSTEGDTIFSLPGGLAVDRQRGVVYVDDALGQRIYILDGQDGHILRAAGRKGDGPGEYLMPGNMSLSPDRRMLAVHDAGRESVEFLAPDLKPIGRRPIGMLYFAKGMLLINDSTVVLSGGRMLWQQALASLIWAAPDAVTINGPLPPPARDPKDLTLMSARIYVAGGALARGRSGVLMAEARNGDVWLVTPNSKKLLAHGPGGIEDAVEKFMRPEKINGRDGTSPWFRFPHAIFLEEEGPNTFLLGWSELDNHRFQFYLLRPGVKAALVGEISESVYGIARFDSSSFILLIEPMTGDYRIERRSIALRRLARGP